MSEYGLEATPSEHFLIVFKEDVSIHAIRRVIGMVKKAGGKLILITGNGKALVVNISQSSAAGIRGLPYVRHVGGVRIGKRKIMRKRV